MTPTAMATMVSTVDVTHDLPKLMKDIKAQKPDVLFNALHGRWGEDGNIQGILNFLGIPYTHSGVMAIRAIRGINCFTCRTQASPCSFPK